MQVRTMTVAVLGLALLAPLPGAPPRAQTSSAHDHIGHVANGFGGTPDGQGLLPTAVAEAEIVARHAALAAADPTNLDGIKRHIGHMLHAIDPALAPDGGPGLGYGVRPAAEGVARHIELAASSDGATDNVKTHAHHVATASRNVVRRADAIVALAQRIRAATSAADAAAPLAQLDVLVQALVAGSDADGDGRIGWQEGEGGLRQMTQHMTLMRRGEGLTN